MRARDCHDRQVIRDVHGDAPLFVGDERQVWDVVDEPLGRHEVGMRATPESSSLLYGSDPAEIVCAIETMRERAGELAAALPAAPKPITADDENRAVESYVAGWTLDQVASELGVSRDRVYRLMRKRGVDMRGRGGVNGWTRAAA